jgi:membrane protein implicated in regulation of membrane protease activity
MIRILLLVLVGFIVVIGGLRTIAAFIAFIADMSKSGQHAPEWLGAMTGSLVITVLLGWVWRKIYHSRKPDPSLPKTKE